MKLTWTRTDVAMISDNFVILTMQQTTKATKIQWKKTIKTKSKMRRLSVNVMQIKRGHSYLTTKRKHKILNSNAAMFIYHHHQNRDINEEWKLFYVKNNVAMGKKSLWKNKTSTRSCHWHQLYRLLLMISDGMTWSWNG